jgi:hypothetical protein
MAPTVAEKEHLLTDALDFIAYNEFTGGVNGEEWARCLDCGAGDGEQHSERCRWLALMKRSGRRG